MQSCIKTAPGKVEMMDIPIPTPGPGEIVIKTTLGTVCGSDMHFLDDIPTELIIPLYPSMAGFLAQGCQWATKAWARCTRWGRA